MNKEQVAANRQPPDQRRLLVGDYYTHDRTGTRWICQSLTEFIGPDGRIHCSVELKAAGGEPEQA